MLANAEANGVHDDPAFNYIVAELLPSWIPEIQRSLIKKDHARRRTESIRTNGPAERYTTEEIGERDGWICGVCRDPVDPTLEHPHPLSPSKDHIVPIALGGTDTGDNMWITHWGCNHERNASPIPPVHEAKARLARRVVREQERDAWSPRRGWGPDEQLHRERSGVAVGGGAACARSRRWCRRHAARRSGRLLLQRRPRRDRGPGTPLERTTKSRDVTRTGRAAIVVDGVLPPPQPRAPHHYPPGSVAPSQTGRGWSHQFPCYPQPS